MVEHAVRLTIGATGDVVVRAGLLGAEAGEDPVAHGVVARDDGGHVDGGDPVGAGIDAPAEADDEAAAAHGGELAGGVGGGAVDVGGNLLGAARTVGEASKYGVLDRPGPPGHGRRHGRYCGKRQRWRLGLRAAVDAAAEVDDEAAAAQGEEVAVSGAGHDADLGSDLPGATRPVGEQGEDALADRRRGLRGGEAGGQRQEVGAGVGGAAEAGDEAALAQCPEVVARDDGGAADVGGDALKTGWATSQEHEDAVAVVPHGAAAAVAEGRRCRDAIGTDVDAGAEAQDEAAAAQGSEVAGGGDEGAAEVGGELGQAARPTREAGESCGLRRRRGREVVRVCRECRVALEGVEAPADLDDVAALTQDF